MAQIRHISVLHVFDSEAPETQDQLVDSDKHLFHALADDIRKQSGCSREEANQLAVKGFSVVVVRSDVDRNVSRLGEHTSALGYQTIEHLIDQGDRITGGKIEAIASSLFLLGSRIVVLHDTPFTPETALRVLGVVNDWEYSAAQWCLLLGRPKSKFLAGKTGFHFGIANLTYLRGGMLETSADVPTTGSQYILDEVFRILTRSVKRHGWGEHYFDVT
jgi:hypothetical protein